MKILIISDAWTPQINGVVRTLQATARELERLGHEVRVFGPDPGGRFCLPAPSYPEIKLEFFAGRRLRKLAEEFAPDFIHIATEGPLGWTARHYCLRHDLPFTTSYHTRFPEYLAARCPSFLAKAVCRLAYSALRRFHAPARAVMVATASIERDLVFRDFEHTIRWSRGVDTDLYQPFGKTEGNDANLPRPVLLCVGRAAIEKNLRAFLELKTAGSLVVIGDGPDLEALRAAYPHAHFRGRMTGESLARAYAAADLFVFPSLTDTFGLVLLEACASGLRIAACPAPGPIDLFHGRGCENFACLNGDLQKAVDHALTLADDPALPRAFALGYSWAACTRQFVTNLQAPFAENSAAFERWRTQNM